MSTKAPLKGAKENLVTTEVGLPTGVRMLVSHRQGSAQGLGHTEQLGPGRGPEREGLTRERPGTKVVGVKTHAGGPGGCRAAEEG